MSEATWKRRLTTYVDWFAAESLSSVAGDRGTGAEAEGAEIGGEYLDGEAEAEGLGDMAWELAPAAQSMTKILTYRMAMVAQQ